MGLFKRLFKGLGRMLGKTAKGLGRAVAKPLAKLGPASFLLGGIPGIGPALRGATRAASALHPVSMGSRLLQGKSALPGIKRTGGGFGGGGGSGGAAGGGTTGGGFGGGGSDTYGTDVAGGSNLGNMQLQDPASGEWWKRRVLPTSPVDLVRGGTLPTSPGGLPNERFGGALSRLFRTAGSQPQGQWLRAGLGALPGLSEMSEGRRMRKVAEGDLAALSGAYDPVISRLQGDTGVPLEETALYKADVQAGTKGLEERYKDLLKGQQEQFRSLRSAGGESGASGARMAAARQLAKEQAEREQSAKTTALGRADQRRRAQLQYLDQLRLQREQLLSAARQRVARARSGSRRGLINAITGGYGGYRGGSGLDPRALMSLFG